MGSLYNFIKNLHVYMSYLVIINNIIEFLLVRSYFKRIDTFDEINWNSRK